jgi:uncharacterized repeat protein (TIGR01451 family)
MLQIDVYDSATRDGQGRSLHVTRRRVMRSNRKPFVGAIVVLTLLALALLLSAHPLTANPGPAVTMSAQASPGSVAAGSVVDYSITMVNTGDQGATNLALAATLPSGFSYVAGSAELSFNSIASHWPNQNPIVSGQTLTWNNSNIADLVVPSKRFGNYYGIHTFVQDHLYDPILETQLNKALELNGAGSYVTQLFYPVTTASSGANPNWKVFVQRTCAKGLVPIIRLATQFTGSYWAKPTLDGALAQAFARVVNDLRTVLPSNCTMYVQVLNETNLNIEWGNSYPDPYSYGQFLVQTSNAIRALNDGRIRILNGALSPGGNYNNVSYTSEMLTVPGALWAWDAWASHPYPGNHPATYNIHDGTARYPDITIDSYILEMQEISKRGRHVYDVLATETGYRLTDSSYQWEGFPPITDDSRGGFIRDALQNKWTNWPEFRASTPYELSDPSRSWWQFDWLRPESYDPYSQYTQVRDVPFKPGFMPDGKLTLTFQARAGYSGGTQTMAVTASANNATIAPASASVTVFGGGPSPTPSRTPIPSATPTPTRTAVPGVPTATASATATGTATPLVCLPVFVTSFPVGTHPKGMAVDSASHRLHVGLFDNSQLAIFDTLTFGALTSVSTHGTHSNGVAVDAGSGLVYVTNRDSNNVSVINGRNGTFVTTVAVGEHPFGVAAGGGYAYVANFGPDAGGVEGTVSIINTNNNAVMSTVKIGPRPALAAFGNGKGFVVSAGNPGGAGLGSGALYALAGSDSIASVATDYFAFGAAYLDGRIYVTHRGAETIVVVDAATNQVLDQIMMPGPVYAAAANPTSHHVFAVDATNNRVYVINGPTNSLIGQVNVGVQDQDNGGQGIAVDTQLNRVFVANYAANSVSVLADCLSGASPTPSSTPQPSATPTTVTATRTATHTATAGPSATATATPTQTPTYAGGTKTPTPGGAATASATATAAATPTSTMTALPTATACVPSVITSQSVGIHPKSLAVDVATHRLYVGLFDSSRLLIIDGSTMQSITNLDLAPLGSAQINGIAVDQSTGRVYATSRANNNVAIIDGRSATWITRVATGNLPWGVAAADGRAYIANFADNSATILDTTTNAVLGAAATASQPALAAAGGGNGYVAAFGAGSVTLIFGPANVQHVTTAPEALGVAYADGRIYVGSRPGKRVTVLDAATGNLIATFSVPGPAFAVAVNPVSGHLFVVDAAQDRLYVLDAQGGALIANLPVGDQDVNDGGQGLAVDTVLNRVYVANYAAGSVTIVDDCGAVQPPASPTVTPTFGSYRFFLPIVLIDDRSSAPAADQITALTSDAALPVSGRSAAADPVSGDIYIGQPSGAIAVLNSGRQTLTTLTLAGVAGSEPAALVASTGRLYASYPALNRISIVNTAAQSVVATVTGLARPFGIALDEAARLMYVAEAAEKTVAVIDIDSGRVLRRIEVASAPYLLAFDATQRLLYVATPGDKSVWIVSLEDGGKAQRLAIPGLGLTLGMTMDEQQRVYVVYAVSPKIRAIAAIERIGSAEGFQSDTFALHPIIEGDYSRPLVEAGGIAAHDGLLYATDGGHLWAIDAGSRRIAAQTMVNAAADTFGMALDGQGRLIIADARGGSSQIITPPR